MSLCCCLVEAEQAENVLVSDIQAFSKIDRRYDSTITSRGVAFYFMKYIHLLFVLSCEAVWFVTLSR
jgi:hypothetical protein